MKNLIFLISVALFFTSFVNAGQETSRSSKVLERKNQINTFKMPNSELSEDLSHELKFQERTIPLQNPESGRNNLNANRKEEAISGNINFSKGRSKNTPNQVECDLLILKTGEEIKCKVSEIGHSEIKYKKCDNLEGPTYSILKGQVLVIKYSNGTSEILKSNNSETSDKEGNSQVSDSQEGSKSGKSQLIALLLAIFLGSLGIGRFYLGHIGMGVLYLLTGGLCGIGWLIDIILILTGNLKPKNGEYKSKL